MSDQTPNGATDRSAILADAEWSAKLAIEALTNHRYEIGAGLAALAARAARAARAMPAGPRAVSDMTMVPFVGATREEHPRGTLDRHAGWGPTGDGDADLAAAAGLPVFEQVGADTVTTMQIPTGITETRPIPRTGRCHATSTSSVLGGPAEACWAVLTYNEALGKWIHAFAHPAGPYDHEADPGPQGVTA